jgi:hypothetical protein
MAVLIVPVEYYQEQSENDSLAMSYADDDDRLALHRVQARLVLNVSNMRLAPWAV